MKKIIVSVFILCALIVVSSCKNEIDLSIYLSQKRTAVYTVSDEDYTLILYGEEREDPFISDGYVGSMKKFVTVRVEDCKRSLDDASVSITYGDVTLTGKFEYSPLNGKYIIEMETSKLPTAKEITAVIKNAGEEKTVTLLGYDSSKIDCNKALISVSKNAEDYLNKLKNGNNLSIEVRLRTIFQEERIYFYVSIIDKSGKTVAYLVDGQSFEILASKTI